MAEKEKDYFARIEATPPGKRRLSRLNVKRVLQRIGRKRTGWEQGWTAGKVSFMKTYPVKIFPRWFANRGESVSMQVSIRLVIGKTVKEAPVPGLTGLKVYYRYLKTIVVISKKKAKDEVPESERDERIEFSTGRNIVEKTEWIGSHLSNSSLAKSFFVMLKAIGMEKLKRLVKKMKDKK